MSVLSYQSIRRADIFRPFEERTQHETGLTYGCGAASYDIRLAEEVILPLDRMVLASTLEKFDMPNNVCGRVHDKSSLVRIGVQVQNTFIDPGWRGYLTLELSYDLLDLNVGGIRALALHHSLAMSNLQHSPLRLPSGLPIAQIVLETTDEVTERPYEGVYQDQAAGPQPSKLSKSE